MKGVQKVGKKKITPEKLAARQAFQAAHDNSGETFSCAVFRKALSDGLTGENRKQILTLTGMSLSQLSRIASGNIPPRTHEVTALRQLEDVIGYKFPESKPV